VSTLAHQIDNRPVILAAFKSGDVELSNFPPPESATQQDRKQRSVPLSFQRRRIGHLQQLSCLLSGQPVAEADTQLLYALYPPNSSGQFRAKKTGVSRFVCKTPDRSEPSIDGARCKLAQFQVNSVSGHHSLVERESRFRALPANELLDCVPIPCLRLF
jgi:hypothetical protein